MENSEFSWLDDSKSVVVLVLEHPHKFFEPKEKIRPRRIFLIFITEPKETYFLCFYCITPLKLVSIMGFHLGVVKYTVSDFRQDWRKLNFDVLLQGNFQADMNCAEYLWKTRISLSLPPGCAEPTAGISWIISDLTNSSVTFSTSMKPGHEKYMSKMDGFIYPYTSFNGLTNEDNVGPTDFFYQISQLCYERLQVRTLIYCELVVQRHTQKSISVWFSPFSRLVWGGAAISLLIFISFETSRHVEWDDFLSLERIKLKLRTTVGSTSFNFSAIYLRQSPTLDFLKSNKIIFALTSLSVIVLLTTYETLLTAELVSPSVLKAVQNLKEFVETQTSVVIFGDEKKNALTSLEEESHEEFERQGLLNYFNSTKLQIPAFQNGLLYLAFSEAFEKSRAKRVGCFNNVHGSIATRARKLKLELKYVAERKKMVECFVLEGALSQAIFSIFQVHNREYFRRRIAQFKQHGFEQFWKSVLDLREVMELYSKINSIKENNLKLGSNDGTSSDYISFTNLISFLMLCLFCVALGVLAMVCEVGENLYVPIRIRRQLCMQVLNWRKLCSYCAKICT